MHQFEELINFVTKLYYLKVKFGNVLITTAAS